MVDIRNLSTEYMYNGTMFTKFLPSMLGSSKWFPYLRFPHQNSVYTLMLCVQCIFVISFIQLPTNSLYSST
jgi:hypothetical protein